MQATMASPLVPFPLSPAMNEKSALLPAADVSWKLIPLHWPHPECIRSCRNQMTPPSSDPGTQWEHLHPCICISSICISAWMKIPSVYLAWCQSSLVCRPSPAQPQPQQEGKCVSNKCRKEELGYVTTVLIRTPDVYVLLFEINTGLTHTASAH